MSGQLVCPHDPMGNDDDTYYCPDARFDLKVAAASLAEGLIEADDYRRLTGQEPPEEEVVES